MQYSLLEESKMASVVVLPLALILVKSSRSARSSAHLHDSDVDWPMSVNIDTHTFEISQVNNMDSVERFKAVEYAQQDFRSGAPLRAPSYSKAEESPIELAWTERTWAQSLLVTVDSEANFFSNTRKR